MTSQPKFDRIELVFEARELVESRRDGALSTLSQKHPGFPFGSVCPYCTDVFGNPVFLLSSLAMHSKNMRATPRVSLLITANSSAPAMQSGRVTILGNVVEVHEQEMDAISRRYLEAHPESRQWIGFSDFRFFRLQPVDIYFVAGFGRMGWVTPEEYASVKLT